MESTVDEQELRALCALARAPRVARGVLLAAVAAAGSVEGLLRWPPRQLVAAGIDARAAWSLANPAREALRADLATCRRLGLSVLAPHSPRFPPRLAAIADPPNVLFVRGDPAVLQADQLAVVGSRQPTALGERTARDLAYTLSKSGLVITSGLALGIDAAAHRGALEAAGRTIAVCAAGLDVRYPREHTPLAGRIAGCGALVSEFPPGTPPLRNHFIRRNRLISGLSLGVLVVEAARRSGSLSTARLAGDQGREVFAVPGSIHSPLSRGCHELIRHGAALVEDARDVLSELKLTDSIHALGQARAEPARRRTQRGELHNPAEILLDALGFEPTSVDALIASTGFSGEQLSALLLELELGGRVAAAPGCRYRRILDPGS